MKRLVIRLKSCLLAALFGLLGMSVSSCEKMYGPPEADYQENHIVDEMAANVGIVDVGEQI